MANSKTITVFFDGACPLCRCEIAFYRRRSGADDITWIDVSRSAENDILPGLTRGEALARFHVINAEGKLVSGGEAFACLWAALPGFQRLGKYFHARPLLWILNHAYNLVLNIRPFLQTVVRSRKQYCCGKLPQRRRLDEHPTLAGKPETDRVDRQRLG
jgi:predicted DCC family thiol-disulfide oxidoreductase YuxK